MGNEAWRDGLALLFTANEDKMGGGGSCNPATGTIRLNTELAKKPKDLLEYVVVHELMHLLEARHSERFFELMSRHYPAWPEARKELNELPLSAKNWA